MRNMARYTGKGNTSRNRDSGSRDSVKYEDITKPVTVDMAKSNNFIEIASKVAIVDGNENPFLSISKGYYHEEYGKKYKTVVTITLNEDDLSLEDRLKIMNAMAEAFGLEESI